MLVLSRNPNQRIVIPALGIIIEVIEVKPNGAVKIGIECPENIAVHREEVLQRIQAEVERKQFSTGEHP